VQRLTGRREGTLETRDSERRVQELRQEQGTQTKALPQLDLGFRV
jgi:hypothetical protein